eukprot:GEMP01048520.1.p1 GENE.GEMP01048520.1~~GEMP01048520.1.p1  ORF type:complete len:475 (+),score=87.29 GEMP01048520.1:61-1485(+)
MHTPPMRILALSALVLRVTAAVPFPGRGTAATIFTGHDAIFDLYHSMEKNSSTPHIVFFTQRHCKNCHVMLPMFHEASNKAKNETLNIIFGVIDCSDIRESCKLNLDIKEFPEVRYWDSETGEHIRGIDRVQGRRYRQRRDFTSFVHFARRFAHPFDDERPPTAYPVVADLATSNFDKRIALEPESCYIMKNLPNQATHDWFHAKAVQRHDRNGFFILKEGDRANTIAWPILNNLPDGLHIVSVRQQGVNTYSGLGPVSQGGHEVEQSLDEWIKTTPYPGVWHVHDDAEFEFLTRAPHQFFFALFMLGENNNGDEEATIEKFVNISATTIFGKIGSFGILTERDWKNEARRYGVSFGWFAPGDYHLVIMTANGTYWYEDQDYLTLRALQTEKSVENLLVGHYPQSHCISNWVWWYSRRIWRFFTNWIEYAFLGPMEALLCMAIAFAVTSLCAAAIAAIDQTEQWLMKIENAKIE